MTRPIKCKRCTPQLKCLNCEAEAKSGAFVRDRDEREAMVRITAAGFTPCCNRVHYVPGKPEGDTMPRPAMTRDRVRRPLCMACLAYQESVVEPMGAEFHKRANSYGRAA